MWGSPGTTGVVSHTAPHDRSSVRIRAAVIVGVGVGLSIGLLARSASRTAGGAWASAAMQFWAVTGGAAMCVALAGWVIALGLRRGLPEISLLGASVLALSVLSLVHGVTVAGYLYHDANVSATAGALALPIGLVVALPILTASAHFRGIRRAWKTWSAVSIIATVFLAGTMLAFPTVVPALEHAGLVTVPLTAAAILGVVVLAWRHVRLFRIGRRVASLVTAVAIVDLGVSAAVGANSSAPSVTWWLAHALETGGVLVALLGLALAYRPGRSVTDLLAPLVNHDPRLALELGLSPEVHAFVAALDRKDPLTREHVTRVADLAMRTAERGALTPEQLRDVGLGGLLHDIGKLVVPSDLLTKPGRLTDDEYREIQTHSARGAELLAHSEGLGSASDIVRWHHERHDGSGYPDGISGDSIPLAASIVSVADAWDAMTTDRHYRKGMAPADARRVLEEHSGQQWNPLAVALLLREVSVARPGDSCRALDDVGRWTCDLTWVDEICAGVVPPVTRPTPDDLVRDALVSAERGPRRARA